MSEDHRSGIYELSKDDAGWLAGACGMPPDVRAEVLAGYLNQRGRAAFINLFSQFIGLANSVVANNRESIEIFGIVEGGMHPNEAEKLNLPSIFGACNGAMLAAEIDPAATCEGCAFRIGTLANQSPATTSEADWCGYPGEQPFMCHMDLDDKGEPTKGCAGFAQLRASRKAAA